MGDLLAAGGGHQLGEAEADAAAARGVPPLQALLQRGEQLGEHALGEFRHQLAERLGGGLLLVLVLAREAADELLGERAEDGTQRARRVGDGPLPHGRRRGAHARVHVAAGHVDRGEERVLLRDAQRGEGAVGALLAAELRHLDRCRRARGGRGHEGRRQAAGWWRRDVRGSPSEAWGGRMLDAGRGMQAGAPSPPVMRRTSSPRSSAEAWRTR